MRLAVVTLGLSVTLMGCSQITGTVSIQATYKIMPLGDSITKGTTGGERSGYRGYLGPKLKAAGIPFEFVGSLTDSVGLSHEGHSGYMVSQILDGVTNLGWLAAKPDVVLLMIGTNNLMVPLETSAVDLGSLIDAIFARLPAVTVFVAKILPREDAPDYAPAFNAIVESQYNIRADAGQRIHLVDMNTDYPQPISETLVDGVHPGKVGYKWMASQWFAAIESLNHEPR